MTSTSFNTGYSLSRNSSKVMQPPGGQSANIFSSRSGGSISSASSQADSDVASSRMHLDADQHSVEQSVVVNNGDMSPNGSVDSDSDNRTINGGQKGIVQRPQPATQMQQQVLMSIQQQKLIQLQQQQPDALRSPKRTIPIIRRNPITGEVYENPTGAQQAPVRVRQPPGGRSSGIFY